MIQFNRQYNLIVKQELDRQTAANQEYIESCAKVFSEHSISHLFIPYFDKCVAVAGKTKFYSWKDLMGKIIHDLH